MLVIALRKISSSTLFHFLVSGEDTKQVNIKEDGVCARIREREGNAGIQLTRISHKGSTRKNGTEMGVLMRCLRKIVCMTNSGLIETWETEGRCGDPDSWVITVSEADQVLFLARLF